MKGCLGVAVAALLMAGHASVAVAQTKVEGQTPATMTEEVRVPHFKAPAGREIYIPADLKDNDFSSPDSKWSYARCAYTDDVIVFWERPFGQDLSKAPDLEGHNMKVDIRNLLMRIQSFYDYYKDELKKKSETVVE